MRPVSGQMCAIPRERVIGSATTLAIVEAKCPAGGHPRRECERPAGRASRCASGSGQMLATRRPQVSRDSWLAGLRALREEAHRCTRVRAIDGAWPGSEPG
jgi:coenzyme F420-reducing hydrogenase gamma subunit